MSAPLTHRSHRTQVAHDTANDPGVGAWERSVGIFRTAETWCATATAGMPAGMGGVVWWAPADSSKSIFMPLMVSAGEVPAPYRVGNPAVLDRRSAYWAHKYLQNIAQLRYSRMIGHIQANSRRFEQRALALVEAARSDARQAEADGAKLTPSELSSRLWKLLDDHASEVGCSGRRRIQKSLRAPGRRRIQKSLRALGHRIQKSLRAPGRLTLLCIVTRPPRNRQPTMPESRTATATTTHTHMSPTHHTSRILTLLDLPRRSPAPTHSPPEITSPHPPSLRKQVLAATWSLTDQLMVMYADGTLTTTNPDGSPNSVDLGYSVAYLEANGYTRGPPRTGELPGGATWGAEPHLTIRDGTTKLVALDSSSGVAASAPKGLAIVGGVVGVAFASVAVWFATVKGLAVRNGLDMAGNDALTAWPAAAACSAADDASNAEDYRPFSA